MAGLLLAPLRAWESLWATRLGRAIGYLGALGGLLWAQLIYFPVEYTPPPAGVPASAWPWAALLEALWRHDALYFRNRFDGARVHALLGGGPSFEFTRQPSHHHHDHGHDHHH